MSITKKVKKPKKHIILLFTFVMLLNGLYAQSASLGEDYWSLDAGYGMTNVFIRGLTNQFIIDPKVWMSRQLMLGTRLGLNYSAENILAFEGQAYVRWNFLRLGRPANPVLVFLQGGVGILAANQEADTLSKDAAELRNSVMGEFNAGLTIPIASNWHIEPSIRWGYPHIAGFTITAGYKFPLFHRTKNREVLPVYEKQPSFNYERPPASNYEWQPVQNYENQPSSDYEEEPVSEIEIAQAAPEPETQQSLEEFLKDKIVTRVDSILFGPDSGQYNERVDQNTRNLNEAALNNIAKTLIENPGLRVRIEGHANPTTNDPGETESLMILSRMRADTIAGKLREKGVSEEQMVISAFGGSKTVTKNVMNMNRRVELIVIQG
jgi:outer membrane protein OmpA-like peptidoglycan-associated protein